MKNFNFFADFQMKILLVIWVHTWLSGNDVLLH